MRVRAHCEWSVEPSAVASGAVRWRGVGRALHIVMISVSLRRGSMNTALLLTARSLLPDGVTAALYDGMAALPHFNPDDDREGEPVDPAVADLRAQIASADALLICTPEYAGASPGALKNLLEWTVGDASTYRSPIAWINAAGTAAPTGAADAHDSLRKVLGYVHADIIDRACVRIPVERQAAGPDGTITDPAIRQQIANAVDTLAAEVADRRTRPPE